MRMLYEDGEHAYAKGKGVPSRDPAPKLPRLLTDAPAAAEVRETSQMRVEMCQRARVLGTIQI